VEKDVPGTRFPSLLINKIAPPRLFKTLLRKRLFDVLDSVGRKGPVWISGPAGSGKSTLMASYLAERKTSCLWYQVDAGDADPATFFYYLGLAVDRAADRHRPRLPLMTPEYLSGIDAFARRFFEDACQRFEGPVWIVFDNLQEVPFEPVLQLIMRHMFPKVDQNVRVAVISRSDPAPAKVGRPLDPPMSVIDWPQLAFTGAEFRQVLKALGRGPAAFRQAETIHRMTSGWIAGLMLWLQHTADGRTVPEAIPDQPPAIVFDYFTSEIMEKLKPRTRTFLLQISLLAEVTAQSATRLTNTAAAGEILESLARQNFFLETRPGSQTRYQFHPLFLSFLQTRLVKEFNAPVVRAWCLRAGALMAEAGLWDQAVRLYSQAGSWRTLADLIVSQAPGLAAQGRFKTLADWIDRLPLAIYEDNPWLLFWKGAALMITRPQIGRRECARAFEAFKASGDWVGQIMSWSTVTESFFFLRDAFLELDHWIDEGFRIADACPELQAPDLYGRFCAGVLGALVLRNPNHPALPSWQADCESLLDVCTDIQSSVALCSQLAFSYNWFGQTRRTKSMRSGPCGTLERFAGESPSVHFGNTVECMILMLQGDPLECLRKAQQFLKEAARAGTHVYDNILISCCIDCTLRLGRLETARDYLKQMALQVQAYSLWDRAYYHFLSSWAANLAEEMPKAKAHAQTASELAQSCGGPFMEAFTTIGLVQALLGCGELTSARTELTALLNSPLANRSALLKFVCELTAADLFMIQGCKEDALSHVSLAFSVAAENGLYLFSGINRDRLSNLCGLALENAIESTFVADFIKRNKLPFPKTKLAEGRPFEVRIWTLGRFEIFCSRQSAAAVSRKTPKKSLELLALLISAGRRGITRESAADSLWPETDGDRAQQNMNTTLFRLRKMLGEDLVVAEHGMLYLSRQYCWVDAWAFEDMVDEAFNGGSAILKAHMLRKAMGQYKGRFSVQPQTPKSLAYAERLKTKYLRTALELKRLLTESGQLQEAAFVYARYLAMKNLSRRVKGKYIFNL
jgi:LuxR family transcriptional regulator, maltose regulon positive regulatory protein